MSIWCAKRGELFVLLGFLKNNFIYLFLAALGLICCAGFSLVAARGGSSSLWCMSVSLQWLPLLQTTGSRTCGLSSYSSWALEERLHTCGE